MGEQIRYSFASWVVSRLGILCNIGVLLQYLIPLGYICMFMSAERCGGRHLL